MMNFVETARKGSNGIFSRKTNQEQKIWRNEKFGVAVKCDEKFGAVGKLGAEIVTKNNVETWQKNNNRRLWKQKS
jgi:hypothetical protein